MSHSNFDEALYAQLQEKPRLTLRERRLMNILELPESHPRRQRALEDMEERVREHFGLGDVPDWTQAAVDWDKLLQLIMTLLPLILKLFGL